MSTITPVIAFGLSVLFAVLILVGGIVLFAVGRGRGALAGTGFVVLALGTVFNSLLSMFAPMIFRDWGLSVQSFSVMFSSANFLFNLVGWGLIIVAVIVLAKPDPQPGPQQSGPPYGPAQPGYGPYQAPWGPGQGRPQGPPPPGW
jgi:hypothetical protein